MNSDSEAISSQLFSEELRLPSDFLVKSLGTCFTVNGSEIFTVFHTCCMAIDCCVFFCHDNKPFDDDTNTLTH